MVARLRRHLRLLLRKHRLRLPCPHLQWRRELSALCRLPLRLPRRLLCLSPYRLHLHLRAHSRQQLRSLRRYKPPRQRQRKPPLPLPHPLRRQQYRNCRSCRGRVRVVRWRSRSRVWGRVADSPVLRLSRTMSGLRSFIHLRIAFRHSALIRTARRTTWH